MDNVLLTSNRPTKGIPVKTADGSTIRLDINADYDTVALDELIHQLAMARASMTPAIPLSRDSAIEDGSLATIEDGGSAVIARRQSGGFRLWLRHSGLGWMAWEIDNRFARGMADYIVTNTTPIEGANLVSDKDTNWH